MDGVRHKNLGISAGVAVGIASVGIVGFSPFIVLTPFIGGFAGLLPDADHNATKFGRIRKMIVNIIRILINVAFVASILNPGIYPHKYAIYLGVLILFQIFAITPIGHNTLKHRALTHYAETWLAMIIPLFVVYMARPAQILYVSFLAGYLSHLLADASSPEGIKSIIRKEKIHLARYKVDSKESRNVYYFMLILPLVLSSALLIFKVITQLRYL